MNERRNRPARSETAQPELWRVFAAVPLTEPVREVISTVQSQLDEAGCHFRWVNPDLAHITLKFYGDTNENQRAKLGRALGSVASTFDGFMLHTSQVGAFPNPHRPRVAWLGLDGSTAALTALATTVEEASVAVGFPREGRPFRSHITLGRHRDRDAPPEGFAEVASNLQVDRVEVPIDRIQLIRSVLQRGGPSYSIIGEWRLGHLPDAHVRHEYG